MKLSSIVITVALAITSVAGCDSYKNCWCVRDNFEYEGKIQNDVAWDQDTVKACVANGGGGELGWFSQNFEECYRYVKRSWRLDGAIKECDFNKHCADAGNAEGVLSRAVCRNKISGFH
ncbi:hypothetical protein LZ30DRAFT_284885 [Colletotrichum cereale]|nr:hypothetical protein LZ30DRAFT_284885 [Colletotrichum cereale]